MDQLPKAVRVYLKKRASIAGKAGRGDSKRKGAFASWTPEAREKRKANAESKKMVAA